MIIKNALEKIPGERDIVTLCTPEQKELVRKMHADKIKFNALLPKEVYERLLKLEAENGFKFHTDFFVELLDVYESTAGIRELVRVRNNI